MATYGRFVPHQGAPDVLKPDEQFPSREVAGRVLRERADTAQGRRWPIGALPLAVLHADPQPYEGADRSARLLVWVRRAADPIPAPRTPPDETWTLSPGGAVLRAPWVPAGPPAPLLEAFGERHTLEGWAADPRCRVGADVLGRRLAMGWDAERALSTTLTGRTMKTHIGHGHQAADPNRTRPVQVLTAFGLTRSIAEWHELTRISEAALRMGADRHGLEGYLKRKHWHP